MGAHVWLRMGTVFTLIAAVLACSCFPATEEDKFCRTDYAAQVRVLSSTVLGNNRVYTVNTNRIYRAKYRINSVDRFHLYTTTNSAACGVNLQLGQTYIITGHFETPSRSVPRRVRISLCGLQTSARKFRVPRCGELAGYRPGSRTFLTFRAPGS